MGAFERTPYVDPEESYPPKESVPCVNPFCQKPLNPDKMTISRGFGYCSKGCRKTWPPIINRLQVEYDAPIQVILSVALKLFRSKRRTAEILDISCMTMEKLTRKFHIK